MCSICDLQKEIWQRAFTEEELHAWNNRPPIDYFFISDPQIVKAPGGTACLYYGNGALTHDGAAQVIQSIKAFYDRFTPDELAILTSKCGDPPPPKPNPQPQAKPIHKTAGYVYILKSDRGEYKIGRTVDPSNRLKTFTIKLPFRVEYELVIKSNDMARLEKELHTRFSHKRTTGEWFNLLEKDLDSLRRDYAKRIVNPEKAGRRK